MSQSDPEPPTVALETLGRYQLLQKLGQGGMAAVYLAHDTKLDRRVAVKILPPHSVNDAGAVARFEREAKALAQLSHAGIVQAFDSDTAAGRYFLVMEYVEGASLSQLLKDRGRLAPTAAADYAHQAALALAHAHDKGLVHRDLKPSNLLVTADGRVKLLDLGLARFLQDQVGDPELTREGVGMGTPDYAAPEQFRDAHHADARSDVYSLGCTLYHLLAGQVPFVSSSLQEKCKAHEHREPPPLNELCPEAPAGLILAIGKMMSKRPQDRFQTAKDAAAALAPYVAGASPSFAELKNTITWQAASSTMVQFPSRSAGLRGAVLGALAAAVLLLGAPLIWQALQPEDQGTGPGPLAQQTAKDKLTPPSTNKDGPKVAPDDAAKEKDDPQKHKSKIPAWDDPDVLTVAQDGSARFPTINAALEQVKPGQTILVLDDKDYRESIALRGASRFRGVSLLAARKARILANVVEGTPALDIIDVPDVTVSGFRLKADADRIILVQVAGKCAGLLLDHLELEASPKVSTGIELWNVAVAADEAPVVIQHCAIHKSHVGIGVMAVQKDYQTYTLGSRMIFRNNLLVDPVNGIMVRGRVHDIQITNNRIVGAARAGIMLDNLSPESRNVLVANNSVLSCFGSLVLRDDKIKGDNIQVCNNLLLDCARYDFVFVNNGGSSQSSNESPGDGQLVRKAWRILHNWSEFAGGAKEDPFSKGLVPPGQTDKQWPRLDVLSRDWKNPDFLRPAKDSPLATAGAGSTDPSLPLYVGAMPPPGVRAWDWSRTWQAPPPGKLLTVSKHAKQGGQYRTLNAALDDAKPWTTIRVLDGETYSERLVLNDAKKHEGIVVEGFDGATIGLDDKPLLHWDIKDVPHVRIRGLRFRAGQEAAFRACVVVSGRAPGVVLEALDMFLEGTADGISLQNIQTAAAQAPVVVRGCQIKGGARAVKILGPGGTGEPNSGVVVDGNRFTGGAHGVLVAGQSARIHVTSNLVWDCGYSALQVGDLGNASRNLLFANNTVFDTGGCFRVWNDIKGTPRPGQVMLAGNIFFGAERGDISCFVGTGKGKGAGSSELAEEVATAWRFVGNWRDLSGILTEGIVRLAPGDHKLPMAFFLSREPAHADFMRPTTEFVKLMENVHVPTGPGLPPYAGAVPPGGVEPWDWQVAWRAWNR
jgi:serine/threonine protein kinase